MRKIICLLILCLQLGFAQAQYRDKCVLITQQVAGWLMQEQTDSIVPYFDSIMVRALPAARLSDTWQTLQISYGSCDSTGKMELEQRGDYLTVSMVLFFEKAKMRLMVTFNTEPKIAGLYINPSQHQYEVPDYVNTFNFVEYKIAFGNYPVIIEGLLSVKQGAKKLPLVIVVQGSGPQDMDGTYGHNKIYKDLAWGIASNEIAVFRYPKRTANFGSLFLSGDLKNKFTLEQEYVEDIILAIEALKNRPEIDSNRIILLGHSQGVTAAIIAAKRSGKIRGIVSASGTPRKIQDLMCEQLDYLHGYEPVGSQKWQQVQNIKQNLVYSLRPDLKETDPFDSMPLNVAPSYWIYLNNLNVIDSLNAMPDIKLLFLHGQRDYQVTMVDFEAWRSAFAKNPNATFTVFQGLNHMYFRGTARSTVAEYEERHNVDAIVIRDIVAWIKNIPQ